MARKFRDAGYEVIFMNFLLPAEVAAVAAQEDVAVVGVSVGSGGQLALFRDLIAEMNRRALSDVVLIAGGNIPPHDARELMSWGVRAVFGPGSPPADALAIVRDATRALESSAQ
jgi:methylmalonyl-CoA mutase C-terminal domain/subunit